MKLTLNLHLLEQQIATLTNVIARCDADADYSAVLISYEESEHLEGCYQMIAALRDNAPAQLIPLDHLLDAARGLRSEHGENTEYDRALVELVMDSIGLGMDNKDEGYALLGINPPANVVY